MKIKKIIWLRRITQLAFLVLFFFLFFESRLPLDIYEGYSLVSSEDLRIKMPVTLFFQMDPLIAISSLHSGQAGLWAFFSS